MAKSIKIAVVGGLGMMLRPAAIHFKPLDFIQVTKVFDRGSCSPEKDLARQQWQQLGATLCHTWSDLLAERPELILICAGKNGDDLQILQQLQRAWQQWPLYRPTIAHLSTLSPNFVTHATQYFAQQHIDYVNYPLTGGPAGAKAATMLILASGRKKIHHWLYPILSRLGQVCYFGQSSELAAQVKLIGHSMVFNNLLGLTTAAGIYQHLSQQLHDAPSTSALLEQLNQGAGGSKQWPLALKYGIEHDEWRHGFLIQHALIDLLYLLELMYQLEMPSSNQISLYILALQFCFVEQQLGVGYATHTVVKTSLQHHQKTFENWFNKHFLYQANENLALKILPLLSAAMEQTVKMTITEQDFRPTPEA